MPHQGHTFTLRQKIMQSFSIILATNMFGIGLSKLEFRATYH